MDLFGKPIKVGNVARCILSRELGVNPLKAESLNPSFFGCLSIASCTWGHDCSVHCVLFDKSGDFIVTGADNGTVKIWSTKTATLLFSLEGSNGRIVDMSINNENSLVAAGNLHGWIWVWSLQTGEAVASMRPHQVALTSLNFNPLSLKQIERGQLVSTSLDGSAVISFYSENVKQRVEFRNYPFVFGKRNDPVNCAMFSRGGAFLATGSHSGAVSVYFLCEVEGPVRSMEEAANGKAVQCIAWAYESTSFITGSIDSTAFIWTLEKGLWKHFQLENEANAHVVTHVTWSSSDAYVCAAFSDFGIRVWKPSGGLLRVLLGHQNLINAIAPHPLHKDLLASVGQDGRSFTWNLASKIVEKEVVKNDLLCGMGDDKTHIYDFKWSPNGLDYAATESQGRLVLCKKILNGKILLSFGNTLRNQNPQKCPFKLDQFVPHKDQETEMYFKSLTGFRNEG